MNNCLSVLGQLRRGLFVEDLDRELAALVDAVRDTGRRGAVTIRLEVGLASKGDDMALKIGDSIKVATPQPERGDTIMYAAGDGRLSRRDPRQIDIDDLKVVEPKAKAMREAK